MMPIKLTRELAFAASLDAGNRSMRAAGRTTWSKADQRAACDAFNLLWPRCPHEINAEDWCAFCPQEGERAAATVQ